MTPGYLKVLSALVLTAFCIWTTTRAGLTSQTDPVDKLTGARECVSSAYHVAPADNATITVKNDGGWCWADTDEKTYWHTFSAEYVAVLQPPEHGHVLVGDVANQKVRVAYRPNPGFSGRDSFIVHSQVNQRDLTYLVAVSR